MTEGMTEKQRKGRQAALIIDWNCDCSCCRRWKEAVRGMMKEYQSPQLPTSQGDEE